MYCKKCGNVLDEHAKFCNKCGTPVVKSGGAPATEPAPQNPPQGQRLQLHFGGEPSGNAGEAQPGGSQFGRPQAEDQWQRPGPQAEPWTKETPRSQRPVAAPIRTEPVPEKRKKKKRSKLKKAGIILLTVLILVVALGIGGTIFYFVSPARSVYRSFQDGDYTEAEDTYDDEVDGSTVQELLTRFLLERYTTQLQNDYVSGAVTEAQAEEAFQAIDSLGDRTLEKNAEQQLKTMQTQKSDQDAMQKADSYVSSGDYASAIAAYEKIGKDSPNYADASKKIEDCRQKYKESVLSSTASPKDENAYSQALSAVKVALDVLGDDADLKERQSDLTDGYSSMVKENAMSKANDSIASGDYPSAIETLRGVIANLPDDTELASMLASTISSYETEISDHVGELVKSGDYDGASSYLDEAAKVLPDSTVVSQLKTTVETDKPVRLCDLTVSESQSYDQIDEQTVTKDTVGNVYSPGNLFTVSGSGYAKYYLGGNYNTITLTVAVDYDGGGSSDSEGSLTFYGDNDQILYTTGDVGRDTAPIEVQLDVTGQQWIDIRADEVSTWGLSFLLSNPVLSK